MSYRTSNEHSFISLFFRFTNNSAVKGLLYLDMLDRLEHQQRFLIAMNTFQQNFNFFHANLIYVRARGREGKSVYTTIPDTSGDNSNVFCTGYSLERNNFLSNGGCPYTSGG